MHYCPRTETNVLRARVKKTTLGAAPRNSHCCQENTTTKCSRVTACSTCRRSKLELAVQCQILCLIKIVKATPSCLLSTVPDGNDPGCFKINSKLAPSPGCIVPLVKADLNVADHQCLKQNKAACVNITPSTSPLTLSDSLVVHGFSDNNKNNSHSSQVISTSDTGFRFIPAWLTTEAGPKLVEGKFISDNCFHGKTYTLNIISDNIRARHYDHGGVDKMSDEKNRGHEDGRHSSNDGKQPSHKWFSRWETHSPVDPYPGGWSESTSNAVSSSNSSGGSLSNPLADKGNSCAVDNRSTATEGSDTNAEDSSASSSSPFTFLQILKVHPKKAYIPSEHIDLDLDEPLKGKVKGSRGYEKTAKDTTSQNSRTSYANDYYDESEQRSNDETSTSSPSDNLSMVIDSASLTPIEKRLADVRSPADVSVGQSPGEYAMGQTAERLQDNLTEAIKLAMQEISSNSSVKTIPEVSESPDTKVQNSPKTRVHDSPDTRVQNSPKTRVQDSPSVEDYDEYVYAKSPDGNPTIYHKEAILVAFEKMKHDGVKFYGYRKTPQTSSDNDKTGENSLDVSRDIKQSSSMNDVTRESDRSNYKKVVHFADFMGLNLESVRQIKNPNSPPHIPDSVFANLAGFANPTTATASTKYIYPNFTQPGADINFYQKVKTEKVCLENVIFSDMTIHGFVRVANISFNKSVHIRYSHDRWVSFQEVKALYVENSCDGPTDRYTFQVEVPAFLLPGSHLELAVFYNCDGVEFWDNNNGQNYSFEVFSNNNSLDDMRIRLEM